MDMGSGGVSGMQMTGRSNGAYLPGSPPVAHNSDTHGVENTMVPMQETNRLADPGPGLENAGHRVLVYTDLKSLDPQKDQRDPVKTLELHLTGNMERYMWSFDGKKYSEAGAFQFKKGERVRMILVNDTMMEHPIHLHGMYMEVENGAGSNQPFKHTIRVKPAERLSVAITPEDLGDWALHCHLLMHMELGMMRVVRVVA
jgi:FtsP/CotA-like multicopper oxidase with cupredoxin domain